MSLAASVVTPWPDLALAMWPTSSQPRVSGSSLRMVSRYVSPQPPSINTLLSTEAPVRPYLAEGRSPAAVHAAVPSMRISVDDSLLLFPNPPLMTNT